MIPFPLNMIVWASAIIAGGVLYVRHVGPWIQRADDADRRSTDAYRAHLQALARAHRRSIG